MTLHSAVQQSVAADVNRIIEGGQRLGLHLNTAKCEVIASPDTVISDPLLQKFSFVAVDDSALLDATLLPGAALDGAWADRCAELSRANDKLSEISFQDAFALLRASFSTPRVLYLLCCSTCSPSVDHDALHTRYYRQSGAKNIYQVRK